MASVYAAIAEHVVEGRAPDLDEQEFRVWLARIDTGSDLSWEKLDDILDELVVRFRERSSS